MSPVISPHLRTPPLIYGHVRSSSLISPHLRTPTDTYGHLRTRLLASPLTHGLFLGHNWNARSRAKGGSMVGRALALWRTTSGIPSSSSSTFQTACRRASGGVGASIRWPKCSPPGTCATAGGSCQPMPPTVLRARARQGPARRIAPITACAAGGQRGSRCSISTTMRSRTAGCSTARTTSAPQAQRRALMEEADERKEQLSPAMQEFVLRWGRTLRPEESDAVLRYILRRLSDEQQRFRARTKSGNLHERIR